MRVDVVVGGTDVGSALTNINLCWSNPYSAYSPTQKKTVSYIKTSLSVLIVTVVSTTNNSPSQDYTNPDNQPTTNILSQWLWNWLPHRLSKRQPQPTTVLLRTPPTQTINQIQTLRDILYTLLQAGTINLFCFGLVRRYTKLGHCWAWYRIECHSVMTYLTPVSLRDSVFIYMIRFEIKSPYGVSDYI